MTPSSEGTSQDFRDAGAAIAGADVAPAAPAADETEDKASRAKAMSRADQMALLVAGFLSSVVKSSALLQRS